MAGEHNTFYAQDFIFPLPKPWLRPFSRFPKEFDGRTENDGTKGGKAVKTKTFSESYHRFCDSNFLSTSEIQEQEVLLDCSTAMYFIILTW